MTCKPSIKNQYGSVSVTEPHFIIAWSDQIGADDWKDFALLSMAFTPSEMKLELLYSSVDEEILDKLHREIDFYLYELENNDPISYLEYHCQTLSNVYSHIHFSLIDRIDQASFQYYIITRSRQLGICDSSLARDLAENLLPIVNYHYLSPMADGDQGRVHKVTVTDYDYHMRLLSQGMKKLNEKEGTRLETVNCLQIGKLINGMSLNTYCHMLALFRNFELIKHKHLGPLLLFYYVNKREVESLTESVSS